MRRRAAASVMRVLDSRKPHAQLSPFMPESYMNQARGGRRELKPGHARAGTVGTYVLHCGSQDAEREGAGAVCHGGNSCTAFVDLQEVFRGAAGARRRGARRAKIRSHP